MTKVLLIVLDDVGVDYILPYFERKGQTWNTVESRTIVIDDIAKNGLMCHRAYMQPVCSSTRYALQSGRYGFRENLGTIVSPVTDEGGRMSVSTPYLPKILAEAAGVTDTAYFGKWHLSDSNTLSKGYLAPTLHGYRKFAGTLGNISNDGTSYTDFTYYNYPTDVIPTAASAQSTWTSSHSVKKQTDDFLTWYADTREDNWFACIAYNMVHSPYHEPPAGMHSYANGTRTDAAAGGIPDPLYGFSQTAPVSDEFLAMCEAVDYQLYRLRNAFIASSELDDITIIILGDNGTPEVWVQEDDGNNFVGSPFVAEKGKHSVYDFGTNVPFIVQSPEIDIPGNGTTPVECDHLIHACDVPVTICDLFGVDMREYLEERGFTCDGVSFREMFHGYNSQHPRQSRKYVYRDYFDDVHQTVGYNRAICDTKYDLIRMGTGPNDGTYEFYDLEADPFEATNLLDSTLTTAQTKALERLKAKMREYDAARAAGDETPVDFTK